MMSKLKVLAAMIAVMLCSCCIACAGSANIPLTYSLGDTIQDFSFTTYDGQAITLSDVLKEKDAVMINIWATWCGPCRYEFPFIEEAYQQYQDDIEIFALSSSPATDTDEALADFVEEMGLSFKIGRDPVGFLNALGASGIPTTLMVDRFGTICFIQSGAQTSTSAFVQLFEAFIGEEYTESVLYTNIPPKKPDVQPSSETELAQALNVEGGNVSFRNDTSSLVWPMVMSEKEGRVVAVSSNRGVMPSKACLHADISARQGDVLAVTFKISSEAGYDLMQLCVNGETVKSFGGEKDWITYAYSFPAEGEYTVTITYTKDDANSAGQDMLWIDSVALLGGAEAELALAGNPVYPFSEELAISVLNESAREIVFSDPTGMIAMYYGSGPFYLIPEDQANFSFAITSEYDPETVIVGSNYDGHSYALSECIADGQYTDTSGIDSLNTTGYCDSTVYMYPDPENIHLGKTLTYFRDETNVDAFLASLTKDRTGNVRGSWAYADATEQAEEPTARGMDAASEATYRFRCVDQNGSPVAGVMLQVCDEETCQVLVSDAEGLCEFTGKQYTWEVHVLKVADGYTANSDDAVLTLIDGGELIFTFTKN